MAHPIGHSGVLMIRMNVLTRSSIALRVDSSFLAAEIGTYRTKKMFTRSVYLDSWRMTPNILGSATPIC